MSSSPISSSLRSLAFLAAVAVAVLIPSAALAQGSSDPAGATPAMIDAGSGSSSASAGSAIAPPPPATIHDPSQNPAAYFSDLKAAKKNGWGLVVLVGVLGLCELLAAAGKKVPKLAWLGKGRVSVAIGAGAAIATTAIASLADGGSWSAVATAAIGSALLYWHPAGTDPAKG